MNFLQTLDDGQIVLASVTDEGSDRLSSEIRERIAEILGSDQIGNLGYRQGWALISIVGVGKGAEERQSGEAAAAANCQRGDCG